MSLPYSLPQGGKDHWIGTQLGELGSKFFCDCFKMQPEGRKMQDQKIPEITGFREPGGINTSFYILSIFL